mmetsp:Transcript_29898/g.59194  ORF Transcript_29898/g.59194 Transcript_29898/m.59194 type:complete len:81 (-) Transcript_29898:19-261(-)
MSSGWSAETRRDDCPERRARASSCIPSDSDAREEGLTNGIDVRGVERRRQLGAEHFILHIPVRCMVVSRNVRQDLPERSR